MSKKRTVHRVSDTKKNKPFVKFNFWVMVIIFGLSFLACFILYMIAANLDDNFFDYESSSESSSEIDNTESSVDNIIQDFSETTENITETATEIQENPIIANPVPESARADDAYFDDAWILTDSTLLDIKYNTSIKNVLGNDNLNAVNINESKVESVYGTITAYQNLQIINPKNIYIMLGSDIGESNTDDMINNYSSFVADLKANLPHSRIYLMQLPPVYTDSEFVTNDLINDYNSRLIQLADSYSIYCIDTNTILKNNTGTLDEQYYSHDEDSLSSQAYSAIYEYILTHTVQ